MRKTGEALPSTLRSWSRPRHAGMDPSAPGPPLAAVGNTDMDQPGSQVPIAYKGLETNLFCLNKERQERSYVGPVFQFRGSHAVRLTKLLPIDGTIFQDRFANIAVECS